MSPTMKWIRIGKRSDIEEILKPEIKFLTFNTVSGVGHRDKNHRLLTLIGQKEPKRLTEQRLGIIYANKPQLQEAVIEYLSEVYASRTNGAAVYTWLPHSLQRPESHEKKDGTPY